MALVSNGGLVPPQPGWYRRWPISAAELVFRRRWAWAGLVLVTLLTSAVLDLTFQFTCPIAIFVVSRLSPVVQVLVLVGGLQLVAGADGESVSLAQLIRRAPLLWLAGNYGFALPISEVCGIFIRHNAVWFQPLKDYMDLAPPIFVIEIAKWQWISEWTYWQKGFPLVEFLILLQYFGKSLLALCQEGLVLLFVQAQMRRATKRPERRPRACVAPRRSIREQMAQLCQSLDRLPPKGAIYTSVQFLVIASLLLKEVEPAAPLLAPFLIAFAYVGLRELTDHGAQNADLAVRDQAAHSHRSLQGVAGA